MGALESLHRQSSPRVSRWGLIGLLCCDKML